MSEGGGEVGVRLDQAGGEQGKTAGGGAIEGEGRRGSARHQPSKRERAVSVDPQKKAATRNVGVAAQTDSGASPVFSESAAPK